MHAYRPIAVAVIAALAACAAVLQPLQPAAAKGPEYITIGGGDLGRAYYAIPEPGPVNGWGGLLLNDPKRNTPAGIIAAPADASARLRGAYELYWDVNSGDEPQAYVPPTAAHGAELDWIAPRDDTDIPAWYTLGDAASAYLGRAVADARAAKAAGATDPDWISAILRDPYYAEPPGVASDDYWISAYADPPGVAPVGTFRGAQAAQLFSEYVATLHHWHPVPPNGIRGYKVYTAAGREVFTFAPATAATPAQVMPAEAGGVFDATPELADMLDRALGQAVVEVAPAVRPRVSSSSSRRAVIAAAIVAAGFAALLGGATALQRRRTRA